MKLKLNTSEFIIDFTMLPNVNIWEENEKENKN